MLNKDVVDNCKNCVQYFSIFNHYVELVSYNIFDHFNFIGINFFFFYLELTFIFVIRTVNDVCGTLHFFNKFLETVILMTARSSTRLILKLTLQNFNLSTVFFGHNIYSNVGHNVKLLYIK